MGCFEQDTKELLDKLPKGSAKQSHDGGYLAEGYKPDRVYRRNGCTWIIEIEASTSRKGFIGGYLKAQKYFDDLSISKGRLLFIVQGQRPNAKKEPVSLEAVGKQISQYHSWLREKGISVQPTYLMYDNVLAELVVNGIDILSKEFLVSSDKLS